MLDQLLPVLVLAAIVIVFGATMIAVTFLPGPKRTPYEAKQMPFECGIKATVETDTKYHVKFYLTAILFILFDIEVIFLYPWALIYTDFLKSGAFIFAEMIVFMFILTFGLFYVWKANALEWE